MAARGGDMAIATFSIKTKPQSLNKKHKIANATNNNKVLCSINLRFIILSIAKRSLFTRNNNDKPR